MRKLLSVLALAACNLPGTEPGGGGCGDAASETDLGPGKAAAVTGVAVCIPSSTNGAQYTLVAFNSVTTGGVSATVTIQGSGIVASGGPVTSQQGGFDQQASLLFPAPRRSDAFDAVLRARESRVLTPRMAAARRWSASRGSSGFNSPAAPMEVGDEVQLNANTEEPCASPVVHDGVVQAVGTRAIAVADEANPVGGYTQADYQSLVAQFDTLIYPLVTGAFGTTSDIDSNSKVVLFFTRVVNELTPPDVDFFVGGFFFARDLFPTAGSAGMAPCPGSNVSEMFYLMVPDPLGTINGNAYSKLFVSSQSASLLAHEFQHLINASRRLYVNTSAEEFEETWLEEGLSHSSEELLFYRQSGLSPRGNLGPDNLRASNTILNAFNNDLAGDFGSLIAFLKNPDGNSPYAGHDSLPTRGSSWSFLRFAVDQRASSDGDTWFRLTNSTVTGRATLSSVFGADVPGIYRRWAASLVADDVTGSETEYQHKSWQYRSLIMALNEGVYPLKITRPSSGVPSTVTLVAGGSAYFEFGVGTAAATINLTATPATLFTLVRRN